MNIDPSKSLRNLFLLDPQVIYFNHGSFGATPRPVFERYQYWQNELERQPTQFFGRRSNELLEQSRAVLAEFLGTTSTNLAYVTNATAGINVVVHSQKLQPGDEVLATNHEYGALDRTWQFLAQKQGFKYINQTIPLPVTTANAFVDRLWEGVTERTRIIFLSHISSPTALIFPVEQVCRRAREQGILTVIDGAHAPGQIPLRLDDLCADYYCGNLHKWLCAPKGTAFLYARPEVQHNIEPLIVSWGWEPGKQSATPLANYVEMQGTRDLSAFLAVPDAIHFFQEHDWPTVQASCHDLLVETVARIAELSDLSPISPLSRDWISQMASAPIPANIDCAKLHQHLYDEFQIEIPVFPWNSHKLVRISMQGYNTPADAQTLYSAIAQFIQNN
jgi:isopenicillin-N epimerase